MAIITKPLPGGTSGSSGSSGSSGTSGLSGDIKTESMSAEVPPLRNIIKRDIQEGEKIEGSLELNGNGYFINPWNETFKIANPVTVEAKITLEDDEKSPETPNVDVAVITEKKRIKK